MHVPSCPAQRLRGDRATTCGSRSSRISRSFSRHGSHAGGRDLPCLVLDLDATLVTYHSEKEQAAATYKRGPP
ncbi:hypothetical protein [Streptomyces lincolnensis]|uniref:hypothetical protein n=1 Tax=Streptomyces lincolnensis TaxID=1915 RepID=UPI0022B252C8|nr:hypothetical protein [Streptomyces lincolnensis]